VQTFLQSSGWIDKEGRIVDLDKFRHVSYALKCACRVCWRGLLRFPYAQKFKHVSHLCRLHSYRCA
jgi:hypothetical protein